MKWIVAERSDRRSEAGQQGCHCGQTVVSGRSTSARTALNAPAMLIGSQIKFSATSNAGKGHYSGITQVAFPKVPAASIDYKL